MKCCFVQLSAELAKSKINPKNPKRKQLINEFNLVKQTAEQDIYTDILNYINNPDLTRNSIKKHIMFWLFSKNSQRQHIDNPVIKAITKYFSNKFPNFYQFIINYPVQYSKETNKLISRLSLDCFQIEANLFFEEKIKTLYNKNLRFI